MEKIQKNYELNAGESFRLDKNGLHGAGALQDEPAAGARVKTSAERRRPTAFRDGGRSVFLFKTGKYWNGKGRNIPYRWRFKSRNLAQRPKLRFGCLTKRR